MFKVSENKQTVFFYNKPRIIGNYSVVGPLEGKGALKEYYDYVLQKDTLKEKSFEKAERKMLEHIIFGAIDKAGLKVDDIDAMLGGDLLNQIVSSSFTARKLGLTFIGLYSACATMVESLALGACLIDRKVFSKVVCGTASHFSSAERQYRFPLELGNQRPPTSQWTVTGGGATVLSNEGVGPVITAATFGKVVDFGIKDVNNMGAAMAPAAMDTIMAHLEATKTTVDDYDMIATGDLGKLGSEILIDLLERKGIKLKQNYSDCGNLVYTNQEKTFMGGSGSGCSASVFNSYILHKIKNGDFKKVLLVATGALLSTTTSQQGESIPGIAHAITIEAEDKSLKEGDK
ncbi:MAG: stage V sporulation protein AD [Clostridia bacterium]|nr:stage V sporulation protein AD [Clostridia bacterium]